MATKQKLLNSQTEITLNPEDYNANKYVDFKSFRIMWDSLKKDINFICMQSYPSIKMVEFRSANMALSRQVTIYTNEQNFTDIYIGVDINGSQVTFMYCKYSDFEHYTICENLLELVDVLYMSVVYSKGC